MATCDYDVAHHHRHGILYKIAHMSLYKLVAILFLIFIIVSLIAHSFLTGLENMHHSDSPHNRRPKMIREIGSSFSSPDLQIQIEELKRIKASVNNELRDLESKRQKLKNEINNYTDHVALITREYDKSVNELEQLRISVEQKKMERLDLDKHYTPKLSMPKRLLPNAIPESDVPVSGSPFYCRLHNCFDFARCSLTSQFPVYVYNVSKHTFSDSDAESFIKTSVTYAFNSSPYTTKDPAVACIYVVLVDYQSVLNPQKKEELKLHLYGLPFWGSDGRNHVLLNLARSYSNCDVFEGVDIGRAMVGHASFLDATYRRDFDVILPPSLGNSHGDVWDQLQPLVPAKRKHLLSFQGEMPFLSQNLKSTSLQNAENSRELENQNSVKNSDRKQNMESHFHKRQLKNIPSEGRTTNIAQTVKYLVEFERAIIQTLKTMQTDYPMDNFNFRFTCDHVVLGGISAEWSLCGPDSERHAVLGESTFALIVAPLNMSVISTTALQVRIYEALRAGAIPVLLGNYARLPFDDLLPWRRAAIVLPKARVTELHFLLRSLADADVLELRRQGRLIWEHHLATTQRLIDTLLAVLRTRLDIPAFPVPEEPSPKAFNDSFVPITEEVNVLDIAQPEGDDFLGVVESPFPSPRFTRNFTQGFRDFRLERDPFHLYPVTPFDPVLPSDAKYNGSGFGFRPIGEGMGGAGKEFSESLGGNWPREQFTIVMLTFEREAVLVNALARLKGLPHLNKVVVVWNSPNPPADDLRWPDIKVPVHVVKTKRNSLNNRFLPYDVIETEAVLSIDDDAHLRHDEIIFGFRVWRENRERLVGFPGRYHAWDAKSDAWLYNANYSCELSMVLTGAAFFHKYYAYLYSYVQPQAIRDLVDEYLNCEDLAMNFLVSHVTRKAPIKVTSRWTFRCPGCPAALSVDEEHFAERHRCVNFFARVYGYMPLLHTQFRADSVLFKTRIPHEKQKCFKYI